jgi:hypothetical protein
MLGREGMTNGEGMAGGRRQIRGNWPSSLQQMQGVSCVTCWGSAGKVLGDCKSCWSTEGEEEILLLLVYFSMVLWGDSGRNLLEHQVVCNSTSLII